MNPNQITDQAKSQFEKAQSHFQDELKKLRTGRAHPSMLDGITVQAYGTNMPLIQVATITAPEPQLLQVSPFDPANLQAIASAIRDNSTLGLNPVDDGRVVRVPVPPLTTERRQQIAKQLSEKIEEAMITMRQARHEALKDADQAKKDKAMTEDDAKRLEKQVDDLLNKYRSDIEAAAKAKEQEIMTI